MGKGKKKGKKEEEGEVPSVSSLAISEDAPSTSQTAEQQSSELGVVSRKDKRKQKQAEARSLVGQMTQPAAAAPAEVTEVAPVQEKPADQPKPEEPKIKKEEPKEEESDGLGLGLGGGGGKKRQKKKKSLAATEAATKTTPQAPAHLQPVPEKPLPEQSLQQPDPAQSQTGVPVSTPPAMQWSAGPPAVAPTGLGRGAALAGRGRGAAMAGRGQPGAGGWGPPGLSGQAGRGQSEPQRPGAWGQSAQAGRGAQTQSGPPPASTMAPPSYPQPVQPTTSISAQSSAPSSQSVTSMETVRATPSREALCRYRIPDKVIGRSVRHIPTKVTTNYLPLIFKPIKVYRYDVIINPDKPKKMISSVFKLALKKQYPNNPYIAFDQVKNCYTLEPLTDVPFTGSTRLSVIVDINDTNGRPMRFDVSFKSTGVVDLSNLKRYMDTRGSTLNMPSEEIQCVDVILRQGTLEAYVKCGRQFFKRPSRPIDLSGGLEMWTGLFQSAIFTTHGFINIDVAHKGFPINQSMIDAVTKSFKLGVDRKIEDQRSREVDNFLSFLKGLRVVATLVGPPNNGQTREFICNGLVECPSKLSFTSEKNGKKVTMTVADYFAKEKGYRIKYPYLNCVWVGPRDKNIYYPMELLQVAYGQVRNRQLNEFQLSNMVREAAAPPAERKRKIEEVAACMNYSSNEFFRKFGLEISNKFLDVDAKILTPPNLDCGDRNSIQPRKGQWQTNRLVKPEALASWGLIAIDCDPKACNYEAIREFLMNAGRQMGMAVSEPKLTYFNVRMTELRNILFTAVEKEVRFLFIIVGSRGRDTYHRVKQLAERDVGILTQCIKENTAARRMNMQTIKNILLKVNSKLMGINQLLDSRTMPNCLKGGDVMIVGADVTHPSPDQANIPSIAAVTASMDAKAFSYAIELSIQTPKKEMIVEFADMMYDHLRRWREKNGTLPRKIYLFRDGVSEGQFAEVINNELTAVHRAYERFTKQKPEVLFLLVQKRHHTRFFTTPKCENVEPGTVVDTHIVHAKELDFYLVSHQAIKGTARPTRYHAVCNDGNIPHDEVEQLTFYLCHLYSRCMRSVSYPTPTYYAHLACFRARSLTYGQTFDNAALERKPERLKVLDKMLQFSRMFFV